MLESENGQWFQATTPALYMSLLRIIMMSFLGSNVYSSRQNVMRASGDSEYVFAAATLPRLLLFQ